MANTLSPAEQVAAQKARWAADVAARKARESAQTANYRANQPIPLYGIGKGMDVQYAPGQMPGASRTEARGREISGYWDPRTNNYVPSNWQRPMPGQTIREDGRTYFGGRPPDWMLPPAMRGPDGIPFQGPNGPVPWDPRYGAPRNSTGSGGGPGQGPVPLPGGQGPVPLPPGGQPPPSQAGALPAPPQGNPYIGLPPPNQPAPGGNKVPGSRPSWYHVQQDPMAAQMAMAAALRTG